MSWVKLDDQFFQHPRVVGLDKDAKLLYLASLTYCAAQLTDGIVPAGAVRLIAAMVDLDRSETAACVTALLTAGLWLHNPAGNYQIHDYLDYNPSGTQVKHERTQTAKRQQKWRDTHRTEVGTFSTNGISNAHSNAVTNGHVTPHPSPFPFPDIIECDRAREAEQVTAFDAITPAPNSIHAVPKPSQDPDTRAAFETVLSAYPAKNGIPPNSDTAFTAFVATVPRKDWPAVAVGAGHYAASEAVSRGIVMNLDKWLLQREYQRWQQPETPAPQKGTRNGYESKTERNERILRNRIARWQTDPDAGTTDHQEPRRLPA